MQRDKSDMGKDEDYKSSSDDNSSIVFDKIVNKIHSWAEKGKEGGTYALKIGKLRMSISSLNLRVEENYKDLGKKIYELYTKGEFQLSKEDLTKIADDIKILQQKVSMHQKLIEKLKNERQENLKHEG
ncbi:MAG: hypothetical protein HY934_00020 [Candidatus Firestonebacteria bacterium]|nr:hypothetical protein [Candidatus Firestonebacteria bacterium]